MNKLCAVLVNTISSICTNPFMLLTVEELQSEYIILMFLLQNLKSGLESSSRKSLPAD